ncbi:hypothetical protein [Sphingorhabdus sp.]|jgi:hypothetical protein|uniref:hypothetical protein n=2 Tax=Sphingorhabdus sp. TaxID=1902408 RepID=UPI003BB097C3
MSKSLNFKSASLLCLASVTLCSTMIRADPVTVNPTRVIDRTTPGLVAALKPAIKASVSVRNQSLAYSTPANAGLTAAAALSSFRIHYDNGDHAIRSINVRKLPDQTAALNIADSFSDDPITAFGNWWVIPGATGGELTTSISSGQEINLTVPVGPANHRLVLGGFSLRIDGSGNNFEKGEVQVGRIAIRLNDPSPQASNSAASRISGTVFTNDGNRNIIVTVQYVWVPTTYLIGEGRVGNRTDPARTRGGVGISGQGSPERLRNSVTAQLPASDRYLIRAFDLKFNNGTHNMLDIGVHLDGATGSTGADDAISWQDNNRDDPIEWSVNYLNLR